MMEENSNIFLVSGDALVYLADPMHEKYSTKYSTKEHIINVYIYVNIHI